MRAIFLDLDDTLLDDRRASQIAFTALVSETLTRLPSQSTSELNENWREITKRHWQRYEFGEISFIEQRQLRFSEFLGAQFSQTECDQAIQRYIAQYESAWQLFPGVIQFLERTANIPKVIITNGQREQQVRKVQATGLMGHISGVVTPEDCGFWKPSAEIFLYAARMLNIEPSLCHMIGDDLIRDIAPARALGMVTHHISNQSGANGLFSTIEIGL
jgi:putative hydrolase of the HAD superfamily